MCHCNRSQFGPAVLLDPLWSINVRVKATNRSRNFGKTLGFFLDHIAVDESDNHVSHKKRNHAEKTLLELVKVLAGRDLASWVKSFINETRALMDGGSDVDDGQNNVWDHHLHIRLTDCRTLG